MIDDKAALLNSPLFFRLLFSINSSKTIRRFAAILACVILLESRDFTVFSRQFSQILQRRFEHSRRYLYGRSRWISCRCSLKGSILLHGRDNFELRHAINFGFNSSIIERCTLRCLSGHLQKNEVESVNSFGNHQTSFETLDCKDHVCSVSTIMYLINIFIHSISRILF